MLVRISRCTIMMALLALSLALPAGRAGAGEIEIVGTGDGVKVLTVLGAAFSRSNPEVKITLPESIGSSGGIEAVGKGEKLLGRVARSLKENEKSLGLTYLPFAKVPVVFFVNPSINISLLTSRQVCAIYGGEIRNWKEVGGPDAPIVVIMREEKDSSLGVLRKSFPGFKEVIVTGKAVLVDKTPEMFEAVMQQRSAIGFGPNDVAVNSGVRVLSIDGRKPTFPDYPSINTVAFVYKKKSLPGDAQSFLAFATSPTVAPLIRAAGGVPMAP